MSSVITYQFNLSNYSVREKLVRQVEFRNIHDTYNIKIAYQYYIKAYA